MIKKYVLSICIAFALLFVGLYGFVFANNADNAVNAKKKDYVFSNLKDKENYIKGKYKKYFNVTLNIKSEDVLDSKNYSQEDLKVVFNTMNDYRMTISDKEGICWATAMTSLIEYYGCDDYKYDIVDRVLYTAKKGKYWSPGKDGVGNAVYDSELDDILDDVFYSYGGKYKKYDANNDSFDLYKTIKKEVNADRVSLFSIPEHTMVACGYQSYLVKYNYKNFLGNTKSDSATENFVVVNDTWSNSIQYSYYPEDRILTGILDRVDFTVTKIIK